MPIGAAICDIWVAQDKFWKLPQSGACEGITMCGASVVFNVMLLPREKSGTSMPSTGRLAGGAVGYAKA